VRKEKEKGEERQAETSGGGRKWREEGEKRGGQERGKRALEG